MHAQIVLVYELPRGSVRYASYSELYSRAVLYEICYVMPYRLLYLVRSRYRVERQITV